MLSLGTCTFVSAPCISNVVNGQAREGMKSGGRVAMRRKSRDQERGLQPIGNGEISLQFFGFTPSLSLHLSTLEQCRLCFGCRRLAPLGTDIQPIPSNLHELEHASTCTLRDLITHRTIGQ